MRLKRENFVKIGEIILPTDEIRFPGSEEWTPLSMTDGVKLIGIPCTLPKFFRRPLVRI